MKLSVSVPDELWDRARGLRPDLKDSHLIQNALEGFTKPAEVAGYSVAMPEDAKPAFEAAREKLAAHARGEFEEGYRAGVEIVPSLSWWDIQSLADRHRFAVKEWARGYSDSVVNAELGNIPTDWAADPDVVSALLKALGNLVPPFGDDMFTPSIPYLRGFTQAFRDLWEQVNGEGGVPMDVSSNGEGALGQ